MAITPRSSGQRKALASFGKYSLNEAGRAYLESRALLDVATSLRFAVVQASAGDHARFNGRLIIPSLSPKGDVVDIAFRCIEDHNCGETGCSKYLFLTGLEKRLYNVAAVQDEGRVIHITEGQLDAASLIACGLPAVGVPGAHAWKPHVHRLFQGFDRVCVWADPDKAGEQFFTKVQQSLSAAELIMLPTSSDVNSLLVERGKAGVLALLEGETEAEEQPEDEHELHYDEVGEVIPF